MRTKEIKRRPLGRTGARVSTLGIGDIADRAVPLERCAGSLLCGDNASVELNRNFYEAYLHRFDEQCGRFEPQLKAALKERWVVDLADRLGCPRPALASNAMRRKLFDDYLMHRAGYRT